MTLFGIRKSLLLALILFILPVGGLLIFDYTRPDPGYSVMLSMEGGKALVGECTQVQGFDDYLDGLNKVNKPKNIACDFSSAVTTMSKSIECYVVNGPIAAYFYWAENLEECRRIRTTLEKSKVQH